MKVAKFALGLCIWYLYEPCQILVLPHFTTENCLFGGTLFIYSFRQGMARLKPRIQNKKNQLFLENKVLPWHTLAKMHDLQKLKRICKKRKKENQKKNQFLFFKNVFLGKFALKN